MNGAPPSTMPTWPVGLRLTSEQLHDLRAVLDLLPDAVFVIEPKGLRYTDANRAACASTGYRREELLAMGPLDMMLELPEQKLRGLLAQPDQTLVIETDHRRCGGSTFPCEAFIRVLPLEKANLLVATVRDITQRKLSEVELRRRDGQLLHAQKLESISVLASGVAHEFNNLLQIIVGVTHASMASVDDQEVREDLQYVLDAAQKATHLTRQLLGFSQRQVMKPISIKLMDLIQDLVKTLRPIMGADIELETQLDPQTTSIFADPTVIQEILINLCINARDAMSSGGCVTIKTDTVLLENDARRPRLKPGRYARIEIRDTGCGMAADVLQRIFDPFYTTKELGQGTGLGLSMVYGAIQQLDGLIEVESSVGRGSTFTIHLPEAQAPDTLRARVGHSDPSPLPLEAGAETVLVVDDEPVIRDFAVYALSKAGYHTLTAADGEEALKIFAEQGETIALVLLDVVMPKMGGHETYERIRALRPDVKAAFCSAFDPDADQVRFIKEAGLRLIQKPVNPPELLQTVREVLDEAAACGVS